jgi:hypothetical protein
VRLAVDLLGLRGQPRGREVRVVAAIIENDDGEAGGGDARRDDGGPGGDRAPGPGARATLGGLGASWAPVSPGRVSVLDVMVFLLGFAVTSCPGGGGGPTGRGVTPSEAARQG